jgi:glycosyltransferase involved in cell wall biosynthesis
MSAKRILLFVMGGWSHTNAALSTALQRQMPGWEIKTVDLLQEFKRDKRALLCSLLDVPFLAWHAARGGGFHMADTLCAPATSEAVNRVASRLTEAYQPAFTLQTTARFNAATSLVPHFTVVDVTIASVRKSYRTLLGMSERSLDLLSDLEAAAYADSSAVFAFGDYVRRSLVRDYGVPPHRAFAIGAGPNIVLGERSRVVGSQNILFVGTDWVRKGGPGLLEAFRALRARHPQAVLNIVGSSPPIDEPGVNVVGRVPREQLHCYFSDARLFALPSMLDVFGIACVEALHFGLPIVASAIGAIPEMVREGINGFTVQPGDTGRLSSALDALLSSDEMALRFGEASHRLARQFTWLRAAGIMRDEIFRLLQVEATETATVRTFDDARIGLNASG